VLHSLGCCQKAGIERRGVGVFLHDLLAFIKDTLDRIAFLTASSLAEVSKTCSSRSICTSVSA
jgi:hypothetical protein